MTAAQRALLEQAVGIVQDYRDLIFDSEQVDRTVADPDVSLELKVYDDWLTRARAELAA